MFNTLIVLTQYFLFSEGNEPFFPPSLVSLMSPVFIAVDLDFG